MVKTNIYIYNMVKFTVSFHCYCPVGLHPDSKCDVITYYPCLT